MTTYLHHHVLCEPRRWQQVADLLASSADGPLATGGGALYGIWRNQIGRPRDELNIMTAWSNGCDKRAASEWIDGANGVLQQSCLELTPTLRPTDAAPPTRQGNYAFRFFETPAANWDEFLALCGAAWPGFEAAYDSQVIGLWEIASSKPGIRESLLLTRRPDLAMWERSKLPANETEAEVRRKLSRRYDLCDATFVYTTTLLTASDKADTARWT